jgi:hypothetical protein
MAKKL